MSIAASHASEFYREVAESGRVWGIKDTGGFPAPINSDGSRAMPFWSSESRALKVIHGVPAYNSFVPVAIEWSIFCERWVPGLVRDGLLAGVNWSGLSAKGFDVSPTHLQRNVEEFRRRLMLLVPVKS
ncbi:DUF2750 domain-containing protein [Azotobacter bryophylli]|uniref:DUF2750 domain-containing protein n=1 Tax=Azotobacter bryophylli TaxID=1986537 RepID=A0ABV7B0A9_9GAMM